VAARLGIADGSLLELCTPSGGASLRAWADVGGGGGDAVRLAPDALAVLGAARGERVIIRAVAREPA